MYNYETININFEYNKTWEFESKIKDKLKYCNFNNRSMYDTIITEFDQTITENKYKLYYDNEEYNTNIYFSIKSYVQNNSSYCSTRCDCCSYSFDCFDCSYNDTTQLFFPLLVNINNYNLENIYYKLLKIIVNDSTYYKYYNIASFKTSTVKCMGNDYYILLTLLIEGPKSCLNNFKDYEIYDKVY